MIYAIPTTPTPAAGVCEGRTGHRSPAGRTAGPAPALLFPLGRLVATPAALAALERAAADPVRLLARHATGDWGDVDAADRAANDHAVRAGERILSVYQLAGAVDLWVLTEADRSLTTLLMPSDY